MSLTSLHSTAGEIQEGAVWVTFLLMKLHAGSRSPAAFPHGNSCAVITRLVFSWEHPQKPVLQNGNGATELSKSGAGQSPGKKSFLQVWSD